MSGVFPTQQSELRKLASASANGATVRNVSHRANTGALRGRGVVVVARLALAVTTTATSEKRAEEFTNCRSRTLALRSSQERVFIAILPIVTARASSRRLLVALMVTEPLCLFLPQGLQIVVYLGGRIAWIVPFCFNSAGI